MELTFKHSTYIIPNIINDVSCKNGNLCDHKGNVITKIKNIPDSKYTNLNCNYMKNKSKATILINVNIQEINKLCDNNIIPDENLLHILKASKILKKKTNLSVLDYINYNHIIKEPLDSQQIHNIKTLYNVEHKILKKRHCYSNYNGAITINEHNKNIVNMLTLCELEKNLNKVIITNNYSKWKYYLELANINNYCKINCVKDMFCTLFSKKYIFLEPKKVLKHKYYLDNIKNKRIIYDVDDSFNYKIFGICGDISWYLFQNEQIYSRYKYIQSSIIKKVNKISKILFNYLVLNNFTNLHLQEELIIVTPYEWELSFLETNKDISIKEQIIENFNTLNSYYFYNLYHISYVNENTNKNLTCKKDCCICLEKNKDIKFINLQCSHSFCFECSINILKNKFKCPLCRSEIIKPKINFNSSSNKEILDYKLGSKITAVFRYIHNCKYNNIIIVTNFVSIKTYLEKSKLLNYLMVKTCKKIIVNSVNEFTKSSIISSDLIIFLEPYAVLNNNILSKKELFAYVTKQKEINILFFLHNNLFEKTVLDNTL